LAEASTVGPKEMTTTIIEKLGPVGSLLLWELLTVIEGENGKEITELRALKAAYLTGQPEAAAAVLGFVMCWEAEEHKPVFFKSLMPIIRERGVFEVAEIAATGMKSDNPRKSARIIAAVRTLRELFNGGAPELFKVAPASLIN
jgi:hypothetical protein